MKIKFFLCCFICNVAIAISPSLKQHEPEGDATTFRMHRFLHRGHIHSHRNKAFSVFIPTFSRPRWSYSEFCLLPQAQDQHRWTPLFILAFYNNRYCVFLTERIWQLCREKIDPCLLKAASTALILPHLQRKHPVKHFHHCHFTPNESIYGQTHPDCACPEYNTAFPGAEHESPVDERTISVYSKTGDLFDLEPMLSVYFLQSLNRLLPSACTTESSCALKAALPGLQSHCFLRRN